MGRVLFCVLVGKAVLGVPAHKQYNVIAHKQYNGNAVTAVLPAATSLCRTMDTQCRQSTFILQAVMHAYLGQLASASGPAC
jgi:hypothetical protein